MLTSLLFFVMVVDVIVIVDVVVSCWRGCCFCWLWLWLLTWLLFLLVMVVVVVLGYGCGCCSGLWLWMLLLVFTVVVVVVVFHARVTQCNLEIITALKSRERREKGGRTISGRSHGSLGTNGNRLRRKLRRRYSDAAVLSDGHQRRALACGRMDGRNRRSIGHGSGSRKRRRVNGG